MRRVLLLFTCLFLAATLAPAQGDCLTPEEMTKVIASMEKPEPDDAEAAFKGASAIRKQILDLRDARLKITDKIFENQSKSSTLLPQSRELGAAGMTKVCEIWRTNGWVGKTELGEDANEALTFLISNATDVQKLRSALPILVAATKKGLIQKQLLATIVDTIRVGFGVPQIFGTRAKIVDNVVKVYPLLSDDKVDAWRSEYGLPPLSQQIRRWAGDYIMPVVRSPRKATPMLNDKSRKTDSETQSLGLLSNDENETITVDTKLVNLNVRLFNEKAEQFDGSLTKDDFVIEEDGVQQEATYFKSTDQPFDLVLLLDFSGSTMNQRDLIKKAAKRFIEAVRANDRVGIVVFAGEITIKSQFSSDKESLKQTVDKINDNGGSPIWDALKFTYQNLIKNNEPGRRTAIVFMTDGYDFSRDATFADAMEFARRGDTTIFPVFTAPQRIGPAEYSRKMYDQAQRSLWLLGEETGGQSYVAYKLNDLKGIYEQVANTVGRVYTLTYEPKDERRDGAWRELKVVVKGRPELVVRTRRGYYAN